MVNMEKIFFNLLVVLGVVLVSLSFNYLMVRVNDYQVKSILDQIFIFYGVKSFFGILLKVSCFGIAVLYLKKFSYKFKKVLRFLSLQNGVLLFSFFVMLSSGYSAYLNVLYQQNINIFLLSLIVILRHKFITKSLKLIVDVFVRVN